MSKGVKQDESAFPANCDFSTDGMTYRQWLLGQALAGMLANPVHANEMDHHIAESCAAYVDALIAEANKEDEK